MPTTMLCRYFTENRVKLPDYCIIKGELTNDEY